MKLKEPFKSDPVTFRETLVIANPEYAGSEFEIPTQLQIGSDPDQFIFIINFFLPKNGNC